MSWGGAQKCRKIFLPELHWEPFIASPLIRCPWKLRLVPLVMLPQHLLVFRKLGGNPNWYLDSSPSWAHGHISQQHMYCWLEELLFLPLCLSPTSTSNASLCLRLRVYGPLQRRVSFFSHIPMFPSGKVAWIDCSKQSLMAKGQTLQEIAWV